jgi:Matrixin
LRTIVLWLSLAAAAGAETFTYWIEPCTKVEAECQETDEQLAQWALNDWARASNGGVDFVRSPLSKARIRLYWAATGNRGLYGEARAITVDGKPGAEVDIRPSLHALGHKVEGVGSKDQLFRHTVVYLTCLHEIGHALGLPHTRSSSDIMYSFEYGGNIIEYHLRYRRKLNNRDDIQRLSGLSTDDERRLLAIYNTTSPRRTVKRGTPRSDAGH